MWKAGLSVVAKLNMARYSNRQRERIQNPSSVDSNSTRATTARYDEPPHFASTLTATKFNRGLCVVGSNPAVRTNMRT